MHSSPRRRSSYCSRAGRRICRLLKRPKTGRNGWRVGIEEKKKFQPQSSQRSPSENHLISEISVNSVAEISSSLLTERLHLDEVIIKSRALAHIGDRLRSRLIDISAIWTQFAPPDRRRDHHARFHLIRDHRARQIIAALVVDAHHHAMFDRAYLGIFGIELDDRLVFALEQFRHIGKGRIEKTMRGRRDE